MRWARLSLKMKASKGWRCEECGAVYVPGDNKHGLAVHHVKAVEDTNDPEEMERRCFALPPYSEETQLQVLCYRCHKLKHEYRQGTHQEREAQRAERLKRTMEDIGLGDGIEL